MKRIFFTAIILLVIGLLLIQKYSGQPSNGSESLANHKVLTVGAARLDITPDEPIRLSGYGSRRALSNGVVGKLWAKALAIGEGDDTALFVTLDLIGVPKWLKEDVVKKLGLPASQVAICATHTHSGPHLKDLLNPIFMADIPAEHWEGIERYSAGLAEKVATVCRMALKNRKPGTIAWGRGKVGFAGNRRVLENGKWTGFGIQPDGPVDHSLPVIRVNDAKGDLLAILTNYACHCTTLGGDFNDIHGDWAGEAQRLIEERHPGVTAMIAIGCGADANPNPRGSMEYVVQHATELADEVDRVIRGELKPLTNAPKTRLEHITLPFDTLPSREDWEAHANSEVKTNYYAKQLLERLDQGETLPNSMDYPIQTWTFGNELAMVFLAGEVVVDYSVKLKERFDADRLWINAYANAAPSYIASRRLYDEGGYEVDRSMYYYDKPTRLSPDTEELVLDEILKQLPYHFYSEDTLDRIPAPIEKHNALATMQVHADLQIEFVAAEPLVMDPIDIAWGADGRMWVVEMADYPLGLNDGTPGGRVRVLSDSDGDGSYENSTLFMDSIPYPTSVLPYRDGVLITTPPDILFARDTDGDGKADDIRSLYTGFHLGNQQHLVNGMQWGLDGWIYLANGDSGGEIRATSSSEAIDINNLDLRILPEEAKIEVVLGRSQFGRNRDSWGNWFGNSNSWPGWHYALDDHYLKRNPHISYPTHRIFLPEVPQAGPVYPISRTLSRYNDYEKSNRFTSACGYMIYEDDVLGKAFRGNSFVSEPVHNLVSRAKVYQEGSTFYSKRAPEEINSEFLASTDNWFRPTAIRAGPDGALYIADMYRLVIEHPEWVPLDWQRKLNMREGHDKGRIYRISRKGSQQRQVPDLSSMNANQWVAAMDSSNRWQRDTAQQLLLWRKDPSAIKALETLAISGSVPEARSQALWTLKGLDALSPQILRSGLSDSDIRVQKQAVRLSEPFFNTNQALLTEFLKLAATGDKSLIQQIAYSLGETSSVIAANTLIDLLLANQDDALLRSAALSSLVPHQNNAAQHRLSDILNSDKLTIIEGFIQTVVGSGNKEALLATLTALLGGNSPSIFSHFGFFLEALRKNGQSLQTLNTTADANLLKALERTQSVFVDAETLATSLDAELPDRRAALSIVSYPQSTKDVNRSLFLEALSPDNPVEIQLDAIAHLARLPGDRLATDFIDKWDSLGLSVRKSILETLLKRVNWTRELLRLVENHPGTRNSFSSSQIATLTTHSDQEIRSQASELFNTSVSEDRLQTIASFKPAISLTGDIHNGRQIFTAQCSICHRIDTIGSVVGPDLTALSDTSPESMLIGILDPNRAVEDKFALYTLSTRDGQAGAGIISNETSNSVTLLNAGGIEQTFQRSQIEMLEGGSKSLMPEGLELGLNQQSMADLLAFLRASDNNRGIRVDEDGSYGLTASHGSATGPSVYYNSDQGTFEWVSDSDTLEWTVYDLKAGYYDIFTDAAMAVEYEGRPFILSLNDTFVTGAVVYSGGMDRFRKRKFGNILIEADTPKAVFKLHHQLDGPQLSLKELRLIPVP